MKALRFIFAAALAATVSFSAFAANWVYDSTAKTISDGVWTFSATLAKNTTNLTIGAPVEEECPTTITPLDFSKPIEKSDDPSTTYTIVELNSIFSYYSGGAKTREIGKQVGELTLPGEGLKKVSRFSFGGCVNMTGDLRFPTSITLIGADNFIGSKITSVYIPPTTDPCEIHGTSGDGGAFGHISELTNVVIAAGSGVTMTSGGVFGVCPKLLNADLSGVTAMPGYDGRKDREGFGHFYGCTALTNITLGSLTVMAPNVLAVGTIGTVSLKTVRFLGNPPETLETPYLFGVKAAQPVTTIVPLECADAWKAYAANGVLDNFSSTWDSAYLASGVDPANRLLILDRSSGGEVPTITAVGFLPYAGSTNRVTVTVEGANLLGGTVKIEILSGNTVVSSLDDLDDFGTFTLGGLEPDTDYTVRVTATNDNGSDVDESFAFKTFAVAAEVAPTAYYDPIDKVLAFFNDGIDRSNIGTGAVYSAVGTRTWGSDTGALQVPKVVFDPSFATARPTTCANWFKSFASLVVIEGIEYLDTSMCTSLEGMFFGAAKLTSVDLSRFKTPLVTSIREMFRGCSKIVTIYANENFTLDSVTDNYSTFHSCSAICGGSGTTYGGSSSHMTGDYARVDNPPDAPGYFTYKAPPAVPPSFSAITVQAISNETATVCVRGSDLNGGTLKIELLVNAQVAKSVEDSDFGDFVFEGLTRGTTYAIKVTAINALGTTIDESQSFSTWGTTTLAARAVYTEYDARLVFYYDDVDRSSWATVYDFDSKCSNVWDPVKNLITTVMFDKSFKDFRPTSCSSWFAYMRGKGELGVRFVGMENLDTREVTSMSRMFYFTKLLAAPDTTYFNTKKVKSFNSFTSYGGWAVMDCSSFDTRSATDMGGMFNGCTTIYANERFVTEKVTSSSGMFSCGNVVGGEGTKYDSTHTDKEYARIDDPEHGMPGYFTYKAPPHQGMKIILR